MSVVFIGIVLFLLLVFFVINGKFLGQYYIQNKEDTLIALYEKVQGVINNGGEETDAVEEELTQMAERGNLSFIVTDPQDNIFIWRRADIENKQLLTRLYGYIFGQNQDGSALLEKNENYEIRRTKDKLNSSEYLEMWGTCGDGYKFIIRSPIESIRESVAITNRFLLYIGSVVIIISILLIQYFSKRLTDPIWELAVISRRMANLDFDARYTSGGKNEIGLLGENFNKMSEALENSVSELKKANYKLQKDIEQKEKIETMRSEFLSNVSHELKTPIALIQGYAEGLKEGIMDDPESREFYCDVIMDEAGKMNRMVKNLLDLNQLEFGDEEISFERFDITELIKGVLQSMDIMISQKEIKVLFRENSPVYVWADEFKVEQVVRNYVSNAINHVNGERLIEIKAKRGEECVRVSVFNTGTPIPEEDLAYIWDKFYKVDKARTREYGGNGIGLSIVKAIMESFHREYGVKNYENGVEFWFEVDIK